MGTKYVIRDWLSVKDMRNELDKTIKAKATLYCPKTDKERKHGYTVSVYKELKTDDKCRYGNLLYKFDVECDLPGHCTYSTQEAIDFLNVLGFNCVFDYSVFEVSENVLQQLSNLSSLGYKTIVRTVRPWTKVFVTTNAEFNLPVHYLYPVVKDWLDINIPKGVVCPDIINYREYLFLPPNVPMPIDEVLRNLIDSDGRYFMVQPE